MEWSAPEGPKQQALFDDLKRVEARLKEVVAPGQLLNMALGAVWGIWEGSLPDIDEKDSR